MLNDTSVLQLRQKSKDLYADLPNRAFYLPRFESNEAKYALRVRQSVLHNYYRKTINHIVSVLSFLSFDHKTPMSEAQDLGLGYNIRNYCTVADTLAQRDGGLYTDITDPNVITHVPLSTIQTVQSGYVTYQNVRGENKTVTLDSLVPYEYNYGLPEYGDYQFKPVHQGLLETNLAWFRLYSSYNSTLEYYAKPLLIRTRNQVIANARNEPLDFESGNKLVEIASGEELFFLSLDTDNVAAQQAELIRLEQYMNESLNRVLSIGTDNTRTATEVELIKADSMLDFTILAQKKRANIMRLMYAFYNRHYPAYTNQLGVSIINPYQQQPDKLTSDDIL